MEQHIKELIEKLHLLPHPEGGYYRETYRSVGSIKEKDLDGGYDGDRNYCTAIYFLLTEDMFSAFHKIKQDEFWHFYAGDPISLQVISENGEHQEYTIGNDFSKGEVPQFVVPGGDWFAAKVKSPGKYALVGCTVSPGFDFKDFVLPERAELLSLFPQHKDLILEYTR